METELTQTQPSPTQNALPIANFIDDPSDVELCSLLGPLKHLARCKDVRETLFDLGVEPFPDEDL